MSTIAPQDGLVNFYRSINDAKSFTVVGTIDIAGRNLSRRAVINAEKKYVAVCSLIYEEGTKCLNSLDGQNKRFSVELVKYKGNNIILSVNDGTGNVIISKSSRLIQIKLDSQRSAGKDSDYYFFLGVLGALISVSPLRQLFVVSPNRRKRRNEESQNV